VVIDEWRCTCNLPINVPSMDGENCRFLRFLPLIGAQIFRVTTFVQLSTPK
jgi:hypothetical protein